MIDSLAQKTKERHILYLSETMVLLWSKMIVFVLEKTRNKDLAQRSENSTYMVVHFKRGYIAE